MDTAEIGKRTRQENRRLTWLAVKQNKASYLMIAPFMLFFLVFTIVPVLMSLPMGDRATVKICVIAGELAIDCIEFPVK